MELFKDRSGIEAKFYHLCEQVTKDNGYVLYDLEYIIGSKLLRVYIMNEKTKSALIEDCVKIDHALTPYFESETWMPREITLEVSSPGIYRQLRARDHFEQSIGQKVSAILCSNLTGEQYLGMPKSITAEKKLKGELIEIEDEAIFLKIDKYKVMVPFNNIKRANLETDDF